MADIKPMAAHESVVHRMSTCVLTGNVRVDMAVVACFGQELLTTKYPRGNTELVGAYTQLCERYRVGPDELVLKKLEREMAEVAAKELDDKANTKTLSIEVERTGGHGEDEASIELTDGDGAVLLTDLNIHDVQELALLLKRHIPYATLSTNP